MISNSGKWERGTVSVSEAGIKRWWHVVGPYVKSLAIGISDRERVELAVAVALAVIHLACQINGESPEDVEEQAGGSLWEVALSHVQAVADAVGTTND